MSEEVKSKVTWAEVVVNACRQGPEKAGKTSTDSVAATGEATLSVPDFGPYSRAGFFIAAPTSPRASNNTLRRKLALSRLKYIFPTCVDCVRS